MAFQALFKHFPAVSAHCSPAQHCNAYHRFHAVSNPHGITATVSSVFDLSGSQ